VGSFCTFVLLDAQQGCLQVLRATIAYWILGFQGAFCGDDGADALAKSTNSSAGPTHDVCNDRFQHIGFYQENSGLNYSMSNVIQLRMLFSNVRCFFRNMKLDNNVVQDKRLEKYIVSLDDIAFGN
jgi:hypothetical protein